MPFRMILLNPATVFYMEENKWLLIPFYSDPTSVVYDSQVDKFRDFSIKAKNLTGLSLAIVDDGSGLNPEDFMGFTNRLIQLPENGGKAGAVRHGLKSLLEDTAINPEFIIQYDGDGDQSYADIPHFLTKFQEITQRDPNKPALLIGDRYSDRLITSPNPSSIVYRQSLLIFFGALARQFGFDVRDWVSGARGYTKEFARRFLEKSRSNSYGLEAEQLVVAYLEKASVGTVPLAFSRPRDPHTLMSKWLENFDSFLLYRDELKMQGQDRVVDVVEILTENLRKGVEYFDISLIPLGENTTINFKKHGVTYSAEIPAEHRAKTFSGESPFNIRKETYR